MRIVFFSYGTRGDVQPQVALAAGLVERGIQARIAAPENLRSFVEKAGIEYAPLHGNSQEIMESESGQRWLRSGDVRAFMKEAASIAARVDPEVFRNGLAAVHDADAIVGGTLAEDLAFTLAEHRQVPFAFAHTIPFETTGDYPNPFVTTRSLPFRFLNRATYPLYRVLARKIHEKTLAEFRSELGLAPLTDTVVSRAAELDVPTLQLWSRHLVPHPADAPRRAITTGFMRLPASVRHRLGEQSPPESLVSWLAAGSPPVYIGFGSMPVPALREFVQDVLEIGRTLDIRIALSPGWNEVESLRNLESDSLRFIPPVDHNWLFSQCAAAVHHGGAGTTAASLEAGIPSVVCSFFADQPFWGSRIEHLGAGVHLPRSKMNRRKLHDALVRALSPESRAQARSLSEALCAEDGNNRAEDALVKLLERSSST
jgi:sterol 3beta-glucosyltransferase